MSKRKLHRSEKREARFCEWRGVNCNIQYSKMEDKNL
jgi:hypothetical protein